MREALLSPQLWVLPQGEQRSWLSQWGRQPHARNVPCSVSLLHTNQKEKKKETKTYPKVKNKCQRPEGA